MAKLRIAALVWPKKVRSRVIRVIIATGTLLIFAALFLGMGAVDKKISDARSGAHV